MLPEDNAQEKLRTVKHDIKNQLSNMYFAVDQLRYELDKLQAGSFALFCVDTIANSCAAINQQLENLK
jgi:hypothetical protein